MRGDDHVLAAEERRAGRRLLRHHVQRRPRQLPGVQRRRQRRLVHDRTARRIDQVGGRLHLTEGVGVEQAARLRQQRRVNRHVVGSTQQLREIDVLDAFADEDLERHVRIVGDHLQAERPRLRRDELRNPAEADQPQHAAAQSMDRHDRRHLPPAILHVPVRQGDLASHGQQQRHRMIGDFVDAVVRHLRDDDPRRGRRRQIDVVDADAEARDDPAAAHLPDHVGGDLRVGDEQRVGTGGNLQDRIRRGLRRQFQLGADRREHFPRGIQVRENGIRDGDEEWGHGARLCESQSSKFKVQSKFEVPSTGTLHLL